MRPTERENIINKDKNKALENLNKTGKLPEILAPAGDMAGVVAAINAGADAVYFGGRIANARQRAPGFDDAALRHAVRLCHAHGVHAYLTVNTLIKDSEWPEMAAYCGMLSKSGIDGLIVQDPGLIYYLRQTYPSLSLQTSTQASVGGLAGVLFFEELGFDRVVLPREMSVAEVREIRRKTAVELKVFAHGALCYCRSGQCLMSSFIGGRSGNRGICAGPCRKWYDLYALDGQKIKGGYLLSMKDLNTAKHARELAAAGIDALKIEGRLRDTAYIYAVTKYYREAFDAIKNPKALRSVTTDDLDAIFSRDFTPGWLFRRQGHINATVQKKRGERIGAVTAVHRYDIILTLNRGVTLEKGDGLAFGEDAHTGVEVDAVKMLGGRKVVVPTRFLGRSVRPGDVVFRNKNAALLAKITAAAETPLTFKPLTADIALKFRRDEPVAYNWRCGDKTGSGTAPIVPQAAEKHALTATMIREQLSKFGGTDYKLRSCQIDLAEGLFLPKKALNGLRRQIINEMDGVPADTSFVLPARRYQNNGAPAVSVELTRLSDFEKLKDLAPDEWVLPWTGPADNDRLSQGMACARAQGQRVKIALPEILNTAKSRVLAANRAFLDGLNPDGYLIRNYEALYMFRGGAVSLEADANLHLFSSVTAAALAAWGCGSAVISRELDGVSIASVLAHAVMPLTLTVCGRQEVMVSDNCVIACGANHCDACPNAGRYILKDQKGARFPLVLGTDGMTRIYNSAKLRLTDRELSKLPTPAAYRIVVTDEEAAEIRAAIRAYRHGGKFSDGPHAHDTIGNFTRGVL